MKISKTPRSAAVLGAFLLLGLLCGTIAHAAGHIQKRIDLGSAIYGVTNLPDGALAVHTLSGLTILEIDGSKRCSVESGTGGFSSATAYGDAEIAVTTSRGEAVLISQLCKIRWRTKLGQYLYSSPAVLADRKTLAIGSSESNRIDFLGADGKVVSSYQGADPALLYYSRPLVHPDGHLIVLARGYQGGPRSGMSFFNAEGKLLTSQRTSAFVLPFEQPSLLPDGRVALRLQGTLFFALSSGELKSSIVIAKKRVGQPVALDQGPNKGKLAVVADLTTLVFFEAAGTQGQPIQLGESVESSCPAVLGDSVALLSGEGTFFVVGPSGVRDKLRLQTPLPLQTCPTLVTPSVVAVAAGHHLYFVDWKGSLR